MDHLKEAQTVLDAVFNYQGDYARDADIKVRRATAHALIALVERLDSITDGKALAVHAVTWDLTR